MMVCSICFKMSPNKRSYIHILDSLAYLTMPDDSTNREISRNSKPELKRDFNMEYNFQEITDDETLNVTILDRLSKTNQTPEHIQ